MASLAKSQHSGWQSSRLLFLFLCTSASLTPSIMEPTTAGVGFKIWGVDNLVYGPVELPVLVGWVKEERVTKDTWVYSEKDDVWQKAAQVPELRMFFQPKAAPATAPVPSAGVSPDTALYAVRPGTLRRVKILADLAEAQLLHFVEFMEVQRVRQWTEIVKQGQHGDAMYLVLEGELRVRMMVSGKETILVTLTAGEFFGEISLFDQGPRSADVVANNDSLLLKVTAAAFEKLRGEAPDLAASFLYAIAKTLTARIRADNKRYRDSIAFARSAGQ
jgi:CRP-like cAMP-binding protein